MLTSTHLHRLENRLLVKTIICDEDGTENRGQQIIKMLMWSNDPIMQPFSLLYFFCVSFVSVNRVTIVGSQEQPSL
jgi:hypothetical protein